MGAGAGSYDMKAQIEMYGRHEAGGGERYFCGPDRRLGDPRIAQAVLLDSSGDTDFFDVDRADDQSSLLTAAQVLEMWKDTGLRPLGKWQMYMFEWVRCAE